jgi:transposase
VRTKELYADSAGIRKYLRHRGIKANIPSNPRNRRKPKRGGPRRFDEEAYRRARNSVERFFAWLKSFKRIRYERLATTFLACILAYLRVLQ